MMPSETPGLFVALFDLSAEANRDVIGPTGTAPAHLVANYFVDHLMEGLAAAGETGIAFDVALFGARRTEAGFELFNLLPSANGRATQPLLDLLGAEVPPRAEGLPRKFVGTSTPEGEPCPAEAFASIYRMVARWLGGKPEAKAPVIVHCTTGLGFDDSYFGHLRSLMALGTLHGPPRLWHARFAPTDAPESEAFAPAASLGASLNTFPTEEVWNLLFEERPKRELPPAEATTGPAFEVLREFWVQKQGNEPQHWEDGYALDVEAGVAVVSDGASEGIFCRAWAALLSNRFIQERPTVATIAEFVNGCRPEWRRTIDYPNLKWSAQNKVDGTGAAATLCALSIGPAAENGSRPWNALAVGDAVLFRVRDGKRWVSFPLVSKDQLDSAPDLLRTLPGRGTIPAMAAEGRCLPGDLFLLATDAVAGHLFTMSQGLDKYAAMSHEDWLAEIAALRAEGKIVNDDCTLLVLRVPAKVEGEPMVELTPQPSIVEPVADPIVAHVQDVLRTHAAAAVGLDGSEIEVIEVVNGIASVRLGAICGSCPNTMSAVVSSLEAELKKHIPEVDMIEAVL
jgi:Fe-S cluster biogenesis protein NfuA